MRVDASSADFDVFTTATRIERYPDVNVETRDGAGDDDGKFSTTHADTLAGATIVRWHRDDDTIEPLSRKSEAVVCTVPWQGWAGLPESGVQEDSPLFLVVEAAQVTGDRSIFSSRAVLAMLQFKWKKFARGWYYLNLLLYMGFLMIISHHATMLTKVHVLKLDRDGNLVSDQEQGFDDIEEFWEANDTLEEDKKTSCCSATDIPGHGRGGKKSRKKAGNKEPFETSLIFSHKI